MGRISGGLWVVGGLVAIVCTFLPGASHGNTAAVLALAAIVLAYGFGSLAGWIPWERASMRTLAIGMLLAVPVLGLAIYLTGGSISYVEPLLPCSLLYAALFPMRWAWPLAIELIAVAGAPLLYDGRAMETAFLPRYVALVAGFLALTAVVIRLKGRLVQAEVHQRQIANRDPLTGIANRRAFDAALRDELEKRAASRGRREEDGEPLALMIFDLDDFKTINDERGHLVGDAVLRQTATRACAVLRSTDLLARIGGDEFAVIAPGARGENAERIVEAIRSAVSARDPDHPAVPSPVASVGLAIFPEDGEDFETLMRAADQRLLQRKSPSGRIFPGRGREPLRLL